MKTSVKNAIIYSLLVFLLAMCAGLGVIGFSEASIAHAQTATANSSETDKLTFLLNEDEQSYKVKASDRTISRITIPSTYEGLPVTAIDNSGFIGCLSLEQVVIPASIKSIGNNAFMNCTKLNKVLGMSGVTSYGSNAFSMCSNLEYLILPNGLTSVGTSMLRNVKATIFSRTLEEDLLQLNSTCLASFTGNIVYGNELVYNEYINPQTNENGLSIAPFQNLSYSDGFDENTTIIIESWYDNVTLTDGTNASGKVLNIEQSAFFGCNAKEIIVKNAEGYNHSINIESFAFLQCFAKTISIEANITINDPIGTVSEDIFNGCDYLELVVLPDTIDTISARMFSDCKNLSEIKYCNSTIATNHLSEKIKRIEAQAFYSCYNLPELYITENIEFIGQEAFCNWGSNSELYQNIYIDLIEKGENWNYRWDAYINYSNCNVEFIAISELNIKFNTEQDGVVNVVGSTSMTVSRNETLNDLNLIDPTSDSHSFNGYWYTTASRDAGTEFAWDRPIKTNLELYAGWNIRTFTVSFPQVNGCNIYDFDNSECINSQLKLFEYGESYSFYIESNNGYYDTKIFVDSIFLKPVIGDVYTITITKNVDITAEYKIYTYNITYENLRKGINPNNITEYTVESDTITFVKPYWEAYDDAHWNIPVILKGSTGHRVIQAVWENPKEFEVKFTMDEDPNATNRNGASVKYTVEDTVTLLDPISPGYKSGEWQTLDGTRITNWDAETYWEDMVLYVKWNNPNQYRVALDYDNETGTKVYITATYGTKLQSNVIIAPQKYLYKFNGFVSVNNGLKYYDANMFANRVWYQAKTDTLKADWKDNFIVVTFEQRNGVGSIGNFAQRVEIGGSWPLIQMPSRLGYYINGYFDTYELTGTSWQYYDSNGNSLKDIVELTSDITLFAVWHTYYCNLYVDAMTYGASVDDGSSVLITKVPYATVESNFNYTAVETMEYTYKNGYKATFGFTAWKVIWRGPNYYDEKTNDWHELTSSRTIDVNVGDVLRKYYSNVMNEDGWTYYVRAVYAETVSSGSGSSDGGGCVADGTLITLADGRQIPVEQLKGNENLLVWNLYTGQFDTAPILVIDHDPARIYEIVNLYFSDGTAVKVISEHGFWNCTLNKYVYLDNNAGQYIGHWFNKQIVDENGQISWTKVQLTDVVLSEEFTTAWSPVTYGHLCYYVNGMLSMPGGINGLFNIFDVSEDMKYDTAEFEKDIETYGLFTYEEISELVFVPEEIFNAVNGQYLKVAIGKGLITIDGIQELINRYIALFA